MVAMAFILPSAAIASPKLKPYSGNEPVLGDPFQGRDAVDITPEQMKDAQDQVKIAGVWQDGNLVKQAPGETDAQLWFGLCDEGGPEYKISHGATIPTETAYKPWYWVTVDEPGVVIEPELEIYKHDRGGGVLIYETSFEDNARNYLEWEQIDGDCSVVGGYYDGWSWSDARATDGDHSFKCTMYDEYKNMQEDYLAMKCCKALDVSDQHDVNVTFDVWVAGEYAQWYVDTWGSSIYTPLDYLDFGFRDCGAGGIMYYISTAASANMKFCNSSGYFLPGTFIFFDTSIPLYNTDGVNTYGYPNPMDYTPFVKKIDGKPGWWHVWAEFPISAMPASMAENFGIWFKWTSDKERVFEGAYVDNIKIYSVEPFEEKVYQGHSQNWLVPEESFWFEFPLCFDSCDGIECGGEYKAVVKIKNDEGGYDIMEEIIFQIKDIVDCELRNLVITDDFTGDVIPDGGAVQYTTDVHLTYTYHNNGNVPTTDIPVKATAYKYETETLAEYDMETGFSYYYFIGDFGQVYLSSDQAWSGTRSMAFNNPDTLHYGTYSDGIGMLFGDPVDMEGVVEAYWDHYYLGKLGFGDEFYTMISSEVGRYAYYWDLLIGSESKIDPWVGPMQPQGFYAQIDLIPIWETLESLGETLDANGNPTYNLLIGYMLANNGDDDFYYNGEFDWSGVYVDDVKVTATVRGDAVWSDTMIIPGPCDPCETCTQQFVWEDVPYSCYEIVIETLCEGVTCQTVTNNELSQSICVLENLEQMGKATGVDYTECTPETWCISDVVGNDCGNDGQGDQYALATNCDFYGYPLGVNDWIALGEDGCGIDLSHLNFEGGGGGEEMELTFDGDFEDMAGDGELTVYAYTSGWGAVATFTDDVDPDGFNNYFASNPAITIPAGATQIAFHYSDDCGWAWGASIDNVNIGGTTYDFDSGSQGWTVVDGDGNLANWELSSTVPYYLDTGGASGQWFLIDDDGAGSGAGCSDDNWLVSPTLASKGGKATKFACDMETWSGGVPVGDPDGFAYNTGWIDSLYGFAHSGVSWAYSWTYGDVLGTPAIDLECNPVLSFWYMAESSFNPMDLEVYANGVLVFAHYGYTHTSYIQAIVPLTAFENTPVVLEFVGLTSDFYGQCLEDIIVEDETCEGPVEGDKIYVNMTYQVDTYTDANVIVEYCPIDLGDPINYTLVGLDSYGDGWDSDLDGIMDAHMEVFVNGVEIISDFTVTGAYNDAIFSADPGSEILVCYHGVDWVDSAGETPWEVEHEYYLLGPGGEELLHDGEDYTEPMDTCYTIGACTDCPSEECPCPDGVSDWCELGVITGNAPGVCQTFNGVIAPPPGTDYLCFRIRFDSTAWDGLSAGDLPGIGFHLHEISISGIVFDPITGEISDFCDDFEDGKIANPTHCGQIEDALNADCGDSDFEWTVGCPTYGEHWEQVGPHKFCTMYENVCNCGGGLTLVGIDSYGDGWDAQYNYVEDCFIDVYVNGNLVVDDFTVTGAEATVSFPANEGDTIDVDYFTTYSYEYYEEEHEWHLYCGPTELASSGVGYVAPFHGVTSVTVPSSGPGAIGPAFPAEPIDEALVWDTEIEDAYSAWFFGTWNYSIPADAELSLELSADGGDNWFIISRVIGPDNSYGPETIPGTPFDLTPWAGSSILIRVHIVSEGTGDGFVCVNNFYIMGKQDRTPPTASISLSGNMVGPGQYAGPVTVTITATDDQGLGEIHYILDGTESVVAGDSTTFTVSENGDHTIEFWAVDFTGNEGAHATVTFNIDKTPPTVEIVAPEPGLYLFGNKLLDMSKPFIIGAFTIEATADDNQGVAFVEFFLNGESLGADIEAPYTMYCAQKNMGDATIEVVAEDGVGSSASADLDITYYKFL
jgi:hypothetical protein